MYFEHIYDKTLAQGSYLIGCQQTGEAIVIDAKRDVDTYLEVAKKNNLKITHITETHIHADFLCGSSELAAVTGAKMYLSNEGGAGWQYEFPHEELLDGSSIKVGNLTFAVLHTPGHTPESISFLLTDHPASDQPTMIFTGDFVFVGDVGRPDLLEEAAGIKGTKVAGAKQMFQSLKRFKMLPDYVQVWPAHGAGSACGKALGAVPSSTVGYEKLQNWALQFGENQENEFVEALLAGQPEPPKYFAMMKHLNKVKRPLKIAIPPYSALPKEAFFTAFQNGMKVIDARPKAKVQEGFLTGTLTVQGNNSFATWMGWLLNYEEQFILLAEEVQKEDLNRKLMRIGLDNLYGFYSDFSELKDKETWNAADVIAIDEFRTYVGQPDVQIVDVRGSSEYKISHVDGADHVFVGTLPEHLDEISCDKQIVVYCQSGDRSAIAYSILRKYGFTKVKNFTGGMKEWLQYKAKEKLTLNS